MTTTTLAGPLPQHPLRTRADDSWLDRGLFPFTSRYLPCDGGALLHYIDEGPAAGQRREDAPQLLMLAGTPMWGFAYRAVVAALQPRCRCVVVDLPGMGLSRAPLRHGQAFSAAADWLRQLVTTLDLKDMTLVVHATAGPIALDVATRAPERLTRLVISNTFAWPLNQPARLARIVRVVSSRWFAALNVHFNVLPRITARVGRRTGRFSSAERAAILGPYRERGAREHLQNYLRSIASEQPWLASLERRLEVLRDKPALLAYGRHDNGYRAGFLDRWKALLPRHRVALLDDAGHFPLEDEPQQMAALIGQFAGAVAP